VAYEIGQARIKQIVGSEQAASYLPSTSRGK
jgi:hypothetical protein